MSQAVNRLKKELQRLKANPEDGIFTEPIDDKNIFYWRGVIIGPANSPYENGRFKLTIIAGSNYPFSPPKIKFETRIYHPNISGDGRICLDLLQKNWSPALTISKALLSIASLLNDPNPEDPLVFHVAQMDKHDRQQYDKIAQKWTQTYASSADSSSSVITKNK